MAKILLVEDDKILNKSVCDLLRSERHMVDSAHDGTSAFDLVQAYDYDIVILDILLPGMDGLSVCRQIRQAGKDCAILMLTGQNQIQQKTDGLDAGADDYLTKPFDARELNARVRALLRRAGSKSMRQNVIAVGNVMLDLVSHKVQVNNNVVHLTPKEFALLEFLMRHKGQVFNATALVERVWPSDDETTSEMIRSHIKNLRKKLDVEGQSSILRTVHKVGYAVDDVS